VDSVVVDSNRYKLNIFLATVAHLLEINLDNVIKEDFSWFFYLAASASALFNKNF
jgi:hypothetical protein